MVRSPFSQRLHMETTKQPLQFRFSFVGRSRKQKLINMVTITHHPALYSLWPNWGVPLRLAKWSKQKLSPNENCHSTNEWTKCQQSFKVVILLRSKRETCSRPPLTCFHSIVIIFLVKMSPDQRNFLIHLSLI